MKMNLKLIEYSKGLLTNLFLLKEIEKLEKETQSIVGSVNFKNKNKLKDNKRININKIRLI